MKLAEQGRTARRRRLGLAVVVAMLMAGCGSTETASPASSGPPDSSAPPPASGPVASATPPFEPFPTASESPQAFDPSAFALRLETLAVIDGRPLAFSALPDGRLYVASQEGRAWVLDGSSVSGQPLTDLRDRVLSGGELGLLGIAVHPRFPHERRVFVHYTNLDGNTVVSSLEAGADGTRLDPASERIILRVDQPFANHNGGAVAFGPDGYLYVSLGDGGSGGDPRGNGQSLDTLLGAILRLDVDAGDGAYAIPPDNPWARGGGRPEIVHYGLRNPWRISFDRATGDLWIGDVGQGAWEEVDVARAGQRGLNFGWNVMEGRHCFQAADCAPAGLVLPVTEYDHAAGCTVIGGAVYRGDAFPILSGGYLFADYCSGRIWAIAAAGDAFREPVEVGRAGPGLVAFGEDAAGELYAANVDGTISRIMAVPR